MPKSNDSLHARQIPKLGPLLRKHFFAGILVLIPLCVIAWILAAALGALWRIQDILPEAWQPQAFISDPRLATIVNAVFTLGMAVILALGVSLLGWASSQFMGRKILELVADGIQHIPVIRSIYSALDQLLKTLAAGGSQQFNRVVYVEYPRKEMWTLAFVTGAVQDPVLPSGHLNLYVPTTPNPTSGFYLIVAEKEVRETRLTVEDAFKIILSLGIAQPVRGANPKGVTDVR